MAEKETVTQLALGIRYDFGDKVFPVVGEQSPGIVTSVQLMPDNIVYEVMWAPDKKSWHQPIEISHERQSQEVLA